MGWYGKLRNARKSQSKPLYGTFGFRRVRDPVEPIGQLEDQRVERELQLVGSINLVLEKREAVEAEIPFDQQLEGACVDRLPGLDEAAPHPDDTVYMGVGSCSG